MVHRHDQRDHRMPAAVLGADAMRTPLPMRNCDRCGHEFINRHGDRFCGACQKVVKAEMEASGYLTPYVRGRPYRSPDQRAAGGSDPSPLFENVVRAIEGD